MNKSEISFEIKKYANVLGFSPVGITSAQKVEDISFYTKWLENGFAGDMDYLKRNLEKREEPSILLPGTKSVICVGLNYYTGFQPKDYKVAKYALGDDYHTFLKEKLQKLLDYIKEIIPDSTGKVYTDTAPILERSLSKRAGLGWIGKNTMLINQNMGSYFLLGEIFLDIELEYDSQVKDLCGNCNACIQNCPTDAIIEPGKLDSNLCLSYLTIESKAEFPFELTKYTEKNIFGCDICQDVCPWNKKFSKVSLHHEVKARNWIEEKNIEDLLSMEQEEFSRIFKNSPVKRAKLKGFLRNVIAVITDSKNPKYLPILEKLMNSDIEVISNQAKNAYSKIK